MIERGEIRLTEENKEAGSSVSAFALTRHFLVAQTFERVFLAEITLQLPRRPALRLPSPLFKKWSL